MILVHFQGQPFNITLVQVYAQTTDAKEAEVDQFYENRQHILELTPKKWCPFHHIWLEYKRKKPRDIPKKRKVWPWSTKWSKAKAKTVLLRECAGHSKHQFPITQEITLYMDITRWSIPKSDWLYSLQLKMEKLYTVSKNKTSSWLWLRSWSPYCKIQTKIEDCWENH